MNDAPRSAASEPESAEESNLSPRPPRRLGASWLQKPANAIGFGFFFLVVAAGLLAPLLAPYDPGFIAIRDRLQPPSLVSGHLLGTDHLGRDIFSRMLYGARVSVIVGASVVILSSLIGIVIGLFGGYSRRFGNLLMRIIDGVMAFPEIVFALALIAALGSSLTNVIIALTFVYVPRVARVVHACTLALRNQEFVLAAEALGGSTMRVAFRHHPAQYAGAGRRPGHVHLRLCGHLGSQPDLSGRRPSAGHSKLGRDPGRGAQLPAGRAVDHDLPGPGHLSSGSEPQHPGRRLRDLLDPRSRKLL